MSDLALKSISFRNHILEAQTKLFEELCSKLETLGEVNIDELNESEQGNYFLTV